MTLILEPDGRYYVSFVVDVQDHPLEAVETVAGVDLGLIDLAAVACSDGTREKVGNPRLLSAKERRLARTQRVLSRKQKASANREKNRHHVAAQHRKAREARLDHHHKLALRLICENQTVAVEGLSVAGLARTQMGKSIHDAGWTTLLRLLYEKADAFGRQVVVIDRWSPTTQTCSVCGTPAGKKSLRVRKCTCQGCSGLLDRDWNAAVNIMVAAGLAETLNARGGSVRRLLAVADPVKQEPTEQTPSTC